MTYYEFQLWWNTQKYGLPKISQVPTSLREKVSEDALRFSHGLERAASRSVNRNARPVPRHTPRDRVDAWVNRDGCPAARLVDEK